MLLVAITACPLGGRCSSEPPCKSRDYIVLSIQRLRCLDAYINKRHNEPMNSFLVLRALVIKSFDLWKPMETSYAEPHHVTFSAPSLPICARFSSTQTSRVSGCTGQPRQVLVICLPHLETASCLDRSRNRGPIKRLQALAIGALYLALAFTRLVRRNQPQ